MSSQPISIITGFDIVQPRAENKDLVQTCLFFYGYLALQEAPTVFGAAAPCFFILKIVMHNYFMALQTQPSAKKRITPTPVEPRAKKAKEQAADPQAPKPASSTGAATVAPTPSGAAGTFEAQLIQFLSGQPRKTAKLPMLGSQVRRRTSHVAKSRRSTHARGEAAFVC